MKFATEMNVNSRRFATVAADSGHETRHDCASARAKRMSFAPKNGTPAVCAKFNVKSRLDLQRPTKEAPLQNTKIPEPGAVLRRACELGSAKPAARNEPRARPAVERT
jgi:hypothetical protein